MGARFGTAVTASVVASALAVGCGGRTAASETDLDAGFFDGTPRTDGDDAGADCNGPAPRPMECAADDECGPLGHCLGPQLVSDGPQTCCGATSACCSTDTDCCSAHCLGGVCSSEYNPCATDGDCTHGAVCILGPWYGGNPACTEAACAPMTGSCIRIPGAACDSPDECSASSCGDGVCPCVTSQTGQGGPCRSTLDCCNGECHAGECQRSLEGEACKVESDCFKGACLGGVCRCLPAGAPLPDAGDLYNDGCCSGAGAGDECTAYSGSACSMVFPDCFGGPCEGRTCACVGAGGSCNVDRDCCAGARRCVGYVCQ